MEEEKLLIKTETNNEKIKNFFINNKKNIIGSILVIVFLFISYLGYNEIQKNNKKKIASKFNISKINFISGNQSNTLNEMKKIVRAKDTTYSPLALYFLVDNKILISNEEINELFDLLINDTKLDKEIKYLIIYKKGLYNSEFETENGLLKILNPLINSDSIWRSHAFFLMGEYFLSKNEKQKAKEFFEKIINLKSSNTKIKLEAQKRIQSDFN